MDTPCTAIVDDGSLEKADETLLAVHIHFSKLLRIKNQICSSFLRLPTEILIQILSFINGGSHHNWWPILNTCYHIHEIMLNSAEVWWKVKCDHRASSLTAAHVAFLRSKGNPRHLIAEFSELEEDDSPTHSRTVTFFSRWKNKRILQGTKLRTLEFHGISSIFSWFSWILEGSLPCLEHLKIHVLPPNYHRLDESVALPLPVGVPLRVLHLLNATVPWSPRYLAGLRELHLRLELCKTDVTMMEDELVEILKASPQLECLSLRNIRIGKNWQSSPKRIVQLPCLTSLSLENSPELARYILAHVDTPAISSLDIIAHLSPLQAEEVPSTIFPNNHVPTRLLSDPPVFKIGALKHRAVLFLVRNALTLRIGNLKITLQRNAHFRTCDHVTAWFPLVPPSITTLQVNFSKLGQQEWGGFFQVHKEVRSIECGFEDGKALESLWDALSPAQEDNRQVIPCPSLELVRFKMSSPLCLSSLTSLLSCLRNRENAGFGLRHLIVDDNHQREARKNAGNLRPLVEVLEIKFAPPKRQTRTKSCAREVQI